MKNDKEKAKPSKRKAKPTKAGETTKQPKPSREKPKPKANEKDEQPKPSKKKPRPTKANEKDEQPKKTKANEKDEQPKKTKADENDEQPKKTKADENDDVTWSNLHEKGMLKGELSSAPYVDEGGDVVVGFQSGRVWRVPHLVPGDIDKSKGEQAALPRLGEVAESEAKKKKASNGGQAEARVGLHPGVRAGEVCQPGKQAPDLEDGVQGRTASVPPQDRGGRRCSSS